MYGQPLVSSNVEPCGDLQSCPTPKEGVRSDLHPSVERLNTNFFTGGLRFEPKLTIPSTIRGFLKPPSQLLGAVRIPDLEGAAIGHSPHAGEGPNQVASLDLHLSLHGTPTLLGDQALAERRLRASWPLRSSQQGPGDKATLCDIHKLLQRAGASVLCHEFQGAWTNRQHP